MGGHASFFKKAGILRFRQTIEMKTPLNMKGLRGSPNFPYAFMTKDEGGLVSHSIILSAYCGCITQPEAEKAIYTLSTENGPCSQSLLLPMYTKSFCTPDSCITLAGSPL